MTIVIDSVEKKWKDCISKGWGEIHDSCSIQVGEAFITSKRW